MLGQPGVTSIKTGITYSAGPCLATAVEFEPGIKLVIVLLNAKDMDCRWLETHKLGRWATQRLSKIKTFKKSQSGLNSSFDNRKLLNRIKHL